MLLQSAEHSSSLSVSSLRPVLLGTVAIAWPLLGLLFLLRSLSGELQPLPPAVLIVSGLLLAGLAFFLRRFTAAMWGQYLPAVTLAMFAVALSIPGTHPVALVIFWLVLVGEEIASGYAVRQRVPRPVPLALQALDVGSDDEMEHEEEVATLLPPEASQQLTRTRDEHGAESLTCLLRVSFAVGEQTHTLHVAFCPPLEGELVARHEHLEGTPCEIKLAAMETFGARLEVKRRGPLTLADEALLLLEVKGE